MQSYSMNVGRMLLHAFAYAHLLMEYNTVEAISAIFCFDFTKSLYKFDNMPT